MVKSRSIESLERCRRFSCSRTYQDTMARLSLLEMKQAWASRRLFTDRPMTQSSRDKRKSRDPSNGVFLFMDKRRLLCGIIYNLHTLPRAGHHSGMQDFFPPLTVSAEYSSVVD